VRCLRCGGHAERDLDTMDTFVDSSWYFLRYLSAHDAERAFDPAVVNAWCPVDMYVGGIDHATMHLLYARFFIKALFDLSHVGFDEPFRSLRHQGQITRGGAKMSKRWGNVVAPEEYIPTYGTDALRLYLLFGFTFEQGGDWEDTGLHGASRFLNRVWRLALQSVEIGESHGGDGGDGDGAAREGTRAGARRALDRARHYAIAHATHDLERFQFNTAVSRVMELVNAAYQFAGQGGQERLDGGELDPADAGLFRSVVEDVVRLLAPATPHLAEELWRRLGHEDSILEAGWPIHDPALLEEEEVTVVIQVDGKLRDEMRVARDLGEGEVRSRAVAHGRIPALIGDRRVAQVVVVPNRLVNIVTRKQG
jgi:leucyl-tRNA synthetase